MVVSAILVLANTITPRLPAPRAGSSRDPELIAVLDHIKTPCNHWMPSTDRSTRGNSLYSRPLPHFTPLRFFTEICRFHEVLTLKSLCRLRQQMF